MVPLLVKRATRLLPELGKMRMPLAEKTAPLPVMLNHDSAVPEAAAVQVMSIVPAQLTVPALW